MDADPAARLRIESPDREICVRAENISKNFGGIRVLENVSFEIAKGEILGFLGPNGAGKTTTVRILTGFFPPSSGRVWIAEQDLARNPGRAKQRIGYLPESIGLYEDMRVEEFLKFSGAMKGLKSAARKEQVAQKIERCGLGDVRKRLIGRLSKGYRQRLGLAQALLGDPELLVLDEPTNGLDPKQIIEIRTLIRELGRERTVFLSTHILPEVSMVCDRVIIMSRGRLVASGTAEELEAGLKKAREILVTAGEPWRRDEAIGLLRSLPGLEDVRVVKEEPDQVSFSMTVPADKPDPRAEISRLFVEKGIALLEIRSARLSLEEIFMRILSSDDSAAGEAS